MYKKLKKAFGKQINNEHFRTSYVIISYNLVISINALN